MEDKVEDKVAQAEEVAQAEGHPLAQPAPQKDTQEDKQEDVIMTPGAPAVEVPAVEVGAVEVPAVEAAPVGEAVSSKAAGVTTMAPTAASASWKADPPASPAAAPPKASSPALTQANKKKAGNVRKRIPNQQHVPEITVPDNIQDEDWYKFFKVQNWKDGSSQRKPREGVISREVLTIKQALLCSSLLRSRILDLI